MERLRREEVGEGQAAGGSGLDRSSYHHAIASLEYSSEEEEEPERRRRRRTAFLRPIVETESTFRPAEFASRLLPVENKPLEMPVLRRAKELLLSHDHHSIARHLLKADCQVSARTCTPTRHTPECDVKEPRRTATLLLPQVARITGVSPELRSQMGVASGLELVTLPHGHQLRLDLMERCTHARTRYSHGRPVLIHPLVSRHHTMAIGVAVDILGCTGSVEERASTLNRIVLVALELKDTVGDLFAFTALMKALDLPQVTHTHTLQRVLRGFFVSCRSAV